MMRKAARPNIYSESINGLLINGIFKRMSQLDLEREDFDQVITFILRREAVKAGKLEALRKYITEILQANNV